MQRKRLCLERGLELRMAGAGAGTTRQERDGLGTRMQTDFWWWGGTSKRGMEKRKGVHLRGLFFKESFIH